MITSKKEAEYHISHTEQEYEWGKISRVALEEKLDYFLGVLAQYDYESYENNRTRINKKYGFSL